VLLLTTPLDAVHGAAVPVSKPGLPSFCPEQPVPPPPLPNWMSVTACSSMPLGHTIQGDASS
jgi:hypothetical protein